MTIKQLRLYNEWLACTGEADTADLERMVELAADPSECCDYPGCRMRSLHRCSQCGSIAFCKDHGGGWPEDKLCWMCGPDGDAS